MSAIGRRKAREIVRTNDRQFEVEILGLRLPSIGEVFEIETQNRLRYEVECVDIEKGLLRIPHTVALVERTDDGPALKDVRSRVISDLKTAPPSSIYEERTFRHTSSLEMLDIAAAEREDRWVDDPWFDKEPDDDSHDEPYAREGDDDY